MVNRKMIFQGNLTYSKEGLFESDRNNEGQKQLLGKNPRKFSHAEKKTSNHT